MNNRNLHNRVDIELNIIDEAEYRAQDAISKLRLDEFRYQQTIIEGARRRLAELEKLIYLISGDNQP